MMPLEFGQKKIWSIRVLVDFKPVKLKTSHTLIISPSNDKDTCFCTKSFISHLKTFQGQKIFTHFRQLLQILEHFTSKRN